jgi:hypothetical protein
MTTYTARDLRMFGRKPQLSFDDQHRHLLKKPTSTEYRVHTRELLESMLKNMEPRDVLAQDKDGNTAVHYFAKWRRPDLLAMVLDKGGDHHILYTPNLKGETPMARGLIGGCTETQSVLRSVNDAVTKLWEEVGREAPSIFPEQDCHGSGCITGTPLREDASFLLEEPDLSYFKSPDESEKSKKTKEAKPSSKPLAQPSPLTLNTPLRKLVTPATPNVHRVPTTPSGQVDVSHTEKTYEVDTPLGKLAFNRQDLKLISSQLATLAQQTPTYTPSRADPAPSTESEIEAKPLHRKVNGMQRFTNRFTRGVSSNQQPTGQSDSAKPGSEKSIKRSVARSLFGPSSK